MYCRIEDIRQYLTEEDLVQLTNDRGTGTVDMQKVEQAISYAGGLINAYLRGRYSVPLSPVPELVKKLCVELAVYELYSRRLCLSMPEGLVERRKEIIKLLEHIQKGFVKLGIEGREGPGEGHYFVSKREKLINLGGF